MTLVRERRHQHALRLPLPPPNQFPVHDFCHRTPSPVKLTASSIRPESPSIAEMSDLDKLAVLGYGNGGTVYKVRHRQNSSTYAIKVLRFNEEEDENPIGIKQQAAREAEILKRVDSQYVVRCYGVLDTGDGKNGDLCFVMEYMEAGSLLDVLQVRRRLPEKVISGMARRVLEGLKYLHGMQIVHRDIKPSNLLINEKGEVKIADFGVSRVVAGTLDVCDINVGTYAYMSPERFDSDRRGDSEYDEFAGDVWALGLALLECHVGHFPLLPPEERPDWATLMWVICFGEAPQLPEKSSPEFQSFIQRCLEKDWRRRGTVMELLNHPFLNKSCHHSTEGLVDS